MCVCVRACVRACVRVCMCVCVCNLPLLPPQYPPPLLSVPNKPCGYCGRLAPCLLTKSVCGTYHCLSTAAWPCLPAATSQSTRQTFSRLWHSRQCFLTSCAVRSTCSMSVIRSWCRPVSRCRPVNGFMTDETKVCYCDVVRRERVCKSA